MAASGNEFTLYAKAERRLCDEAAPVLGNLIRKIEAELGVYITELRVTLERRENDQRGVIANCTIVSALPVQNSVPCLPTSGDRRSTSPDSASPSL